MSKLVTFFFLVSLLACSSDDPDKAGGPKTGKDYGLFSTSVEELKSRSTEGPNSIIGVWENYQNAGDGVELRLRLGFTATEMTGTLMCIYKGEAFFQNKRIPISINGKTVTSSEDFPTSFSVSGTEASCVMIIANESYKEWVYGINGDSLKLEFKHPFKGGTDTFSLLRL